MLLEHLGALRDHGQHHVEGAEATAAVEELDSELFFEGAHGVADGGRDPVQLLGRPRKGAAAVDRFEDRELIEGVVDGRGQVALGVSR